MFLLGDPLFLVFLAPVVAAFYLLPSTQARLGLLLLVSLAYYASFSAAFFVPLLWIFAVSYGGALLVDRLRESVLRTMCFWALVVVCLLPLAFYKYATPLLSQTMAGGGYDWTLTAGHYAIPIGISYYTFAAIGYVCDVYLGLLPAESRAGRIALYLCFFPHVTAGPIPRATALLPQLDLSARFDTVRTLSGLRLILVGACMKLWIADSLSSTVNLVFSNPDAATALENLLGCQIFAFQLYADFAGYSLIAIGSARLLGIKLGDNFRQPFLSSTLAEFWRSWHISLFTWLRDYVFTPLRMEWRRWPTLGPLLAIQITLILVGVWHGTGWGFLAYGTLHGTLLALSMLTVPRRDRFWARLGVPRALVRVVRIPITFTIVALSLILIRAVDLTQALHIYGLIFSPTLVTDLLAFGANSRVLVFQPNSINALLILVLVIGDILAKRGVDFDRAPAPAMSFVYSTCVIAILYEAISATTSKPFVYFQF
jgi:alginate O-acetyltransferase complex protein AlgI